MVHVVEVEPSSSEDTARKVVEKWVSQIVCDDGSEKKGEEDYVQRVKNAWRWLSFGKTKEGVEGVPFDALPTGSDDYDMTRKKPFAKTVSELLRHWLFSCPRFFFSPLYHLFLFLGIKKEEEKDETASEEENRSEDTLHVLLPTMS